MEFFTAEERQVLLQSGIGFGKSFCGALWLVDMINQFANKEGMIVARDHPQLEAATLIEFKKALDLYDFQEDRDYEHNKAKHDFEFWNGTRIMARGANNYESNFRGGNLAFIWADEADFYKKEAWLRLKGRLRVYPERIRVTSSPFGFNHIWEDFFQNANKTKKVIEATTYDNPTLSPEYIEDLRTTYSPRMFEQEVLGKRLQLNMGAVYTEFNRKQHVKPCKDIVTDRDQIYFFLDYNIANYCGTYLIFKNGVVYAIGEENLRFQYTKDMAKAIKTKYPTRPVIVIGDSAGNNKRDVSSTLTNYQIFEQHGIPTKHFYNPPVESRIIGANSNFYHNRVVVDPSCKNLIRDLELLAWKADGSGIDKTSDPSLSHASDGFTYGLWYFLPIESKKESRSYII